MNKIVTVLLFAFCSMSAVSSQDNRLVLGDHQSEIKSHVVNECQKLTTAQEIKYCLVKAGESVSKINNALAGGKATKGVELCLLKTESLNNSWFYFLKCAERQIDLANQNPLPDLALMEFKIDDYRAVWLLSCRKESAQTLSRCLSEKESDFNAFWLQYLSLSGNKERAPRFMSCLNEADLSSPQFKAVNKCLSLTQN